MSFPLHPARRRTLHDASASASASAATTSPFSFCDICNAFFNTNTEIIVREGEEDGRTIAKVVREIGAFTLLVALHENSFLYRWGMGEKGMGRSLNCKVLAIKQEAGRGKGHRSPEDSSTSFDFSQIDISGLQVPEFVPPKVPYRICPSPHATWRTRPQISLKHP